MSIVFGELLVRDGLITRTQLNVALTRQQQTGGRLGDALVAIGALSAEALDHIFHTVPPVPRSVAQTGLSETRLTDLMLKTAYFEGQALSVQDMAGKLCLPLGVMDELAQQAKLEHLLAAHSSQGFNRQSQSYVLTELGQTRAEMALRQSQYTGPAPVPLAAYRVMLAHQTVRQIDISADWIRRALGHLVINPRLQAQLGPAFNSGRSIFLYGPPGTGKTSIAEALGRALDGEVYIPYAVEVDGQIIRIFDPAVHIQVTEPLTPERESLDLASGVKHDPRWQRCRRPVLMAGGELTLESLELEYDPVSKFYEAPVQMKAANGIFILDDFGRQLVPPRQLLNRWIVPLERGSDFLALHTGKKLELPFDQITIFCTNLNPRELVDEAFLRRIRHKIQVPHQTEAEFLDILQRLCQLHGIDYEPQAAGHLVKTYYRDKGRLFAGSHPRDLLEQIIDRARFERHRPTLDIEAIDSAAANYFVDI